MQTLTYGFKKPQVTDQGSIVFPALESNWQQVNDHNHDGVNSALLSPNSVLPSQTGNAGKFLTTDGVNASWATVAGGGGAGIIVGARYYVNSAIAPSTFTWFIIDFNTLEREYGGTRVTTGVAWKYTVGAGEDGEYDVTASLAFDSGVNTPADSPILLAIWKNGVLYRIIGSFTVISLFSGALRVSGAGSLYLVAGDYIDIRTYHQAAGPYTVSPSSVNNWVSISRRAGT